MLLENVKVEMEEVQKKTLCFKVPLVLIHDAGGTTFPYFLLHELDRDVYAIADPLFDTTDSWTGGVRQMAECYTSAILGKLSSGPIIIGGWSLGGIISMEVARVMRTTSGAQVQGLILIDTPYPGEWKSLRHMLSNVLPALPHRLSPTIRGKLMRRFKESDTLVDSWQPEPGYRRWGRYSRYTSDSVDSGKTSHTGCRRLYLSRRRYSSESKASGMGGPSKPMDTRGYRYRR
ncbi:hypothetical protein K461DRAFT_266748 [Myriangium duriaei CBS 260.36]|uniref:Thioesterase domain-containing protein n=1 Tax=Myriangium duriaei CBS 260.36 TaxID=1168546 RepID=A0A9P4JAV6_9PEZI|nr:hypothetical protein K461DRAFT_266748 [Myriangium duriaei CBS 260.36]